MDPCVRRCFGGFAALILTFLQCPRCFRRSALMLSIKTLIRKRCGIGALYNSPFRTKCISSFCLTSFLSQGVLGSSRQTAKASLGYLQDWVTLSKPPGLSGAHVLPMYSEDCPPPPLTDRVAGKIKAGVDRH